ncbi:MAG: DNA cytosine methyltransferase [Pseudomonadota bacterium]|nr:DNA cytosine methyltransferase [Pseudomonadota bacterium]
MRVVDFFCGGGGMSAGLTEAGMNVIGGLDNDPRVAATYRENHPNADFLLEDVSRIVPSELSERFGLRTFDDELLLVGCSPCQYWTLLNTDRSKSRSTAFLLDYFKKVVEFLRPGYVLIENVPGLSKKPDSPINKFKKRLRSLGYHLSDDVLDCSDFGVPQKRVRYVLIASRLHQVSLPKPVNKSAITVRQAIGNPELFRPIEAGVFDDTPYFHSTANLSKINLERIKATPVDGGNRLAWKDRPELQLNAYKGKDRYFTDVYARVYWDRPAPTITTKFISFSNGRFGHPEQNRALSIREGAALQSFSSEFSIMSKSITDAARIIGNAVPPKFAEALGRQLLRARNAIT